MLITKEHRPKLANIIIPWSSLITTVRSHILSMSFIQIITPQAMLRLISVRWLINVTLCHIAHTQYVKRTPKSTIQKLSHKWHSRDHYVTARSDSRPTRFAQQRKDQQKEIQKQQYYPLDLPLISYMFTSSSTKHNSSWNYIYPRQHRHVK